MLPGRKQFSEVFISSEEWYQILVDAFPTKKRADNNLAKYLVDKNVESAFAICSLLGFKKKGQQTKKRQNPFLTLTKKSR